MPAVCFGCSPICFRSYARKPLLRLSLCGDGLVGGYVALHLVLLGAPHVPASGVPQWMPLIWFIGPPSASAIRPPPGIRVSAWLAERALGRQVRLRNTPMLYCPRGGLFQARYAGVTRACHAGHGAGDNPCDNEQPILVVGSLSLTCLCELANHGQCIARDYHCSLNFQPARMYYEGLGQLHFPPAHGFIPAPTLNLPRCTRSVLSLALAPAGFVLRPRNFAFSRNVLPKALGAFLSWGSPNSFPSLTTIWSAHVVRGSRAPANPWKRDRPGMAGCHSPLRPRTSRKRTHRESAAPIGYRHAAFPMDWNTQERYPPAPLIFARTPVGRPESDETLRRTPRHRSLSQGLDAEKRRPTDGQRRTRHSTMPPQPDGNSSFSVLRGALFFAFFTGYAGVKALLAQSGSPLAWRALEWRSHPGLQRRCWCSPSSARSP